MLRLTRSICCGCIADRRGGERAAYDAAVRELKVGGLPRAGAVVPTPTDVSARLPRKFADAGVATVGVGVLPSSKSVVHLEGHENVIVPHTHVVNSVGGRTVAAALATPAVMEPESHRVDVTQCEVPAVRASEVLSDEQKGRGAAVPISGRST